MPASLELTESAEATVAPPADVCGSLDAEAEQKRLEALSRYRILAGQSLPRLVRTAHAIRDAFRATACTITLLPETGVSRVASTMSPSIPLPERKSSLVGACVAEGRALNIYNLLTHPTLKAHPFVVATPHCKSAVGVPVKGAGGYYLGSVNLWHDQHRHFTEAELALLKKFAEIVADELELHRSNLEVRKQQAMLHAMFENSAIGIAIYTTQGIRIFCNQKYCDMFGYTREELIGSTTRDVDDDDEHDEMQTGMDQVARGELELYEKEAKLYHKSGRAMWCRFKQSLITDTDSGEPLVLSFVENIDDKHAAEQARNLLLGEINHRVKNTLAIVQGIARQLMRTEPDASSFAAAFEARVQALARSHDILTQASWQPLPLDQLIASVIGETWQPYKSQIAFNGPAVALNSQTTVMLGLLLNELITNAVKHGALRTPGGRIAIRAAPTTVDGNPWQNVDWLETSDLAVNEPKRRGLGLYLLERAPKLGLSGTGSLEFRPNGIAYNVTFPVFGVSHLFARGLATS